MNRIRYAIVFAALMLGASASFARPHASSEARARAILNEVKAQLAPDGRQVVDELSVHRNTSGQLVLSGATSEPNVHAAAVQALRDASIRFVDSATVYPTDRWAQVRISAASLRTAGKHAAEMATQAVLGTPVRVLEEKGEWVRVQTPDGYIAYVPSTSIVNKTEDEMVQWRNAGRYVVTSPYQVRVYTDAETSGLRDVVTDLVNGCIIEDFDSEAPGVGRNGRVHVKLPDGRSGYIDASSITPIGEWASQDFNPDQILDIAYSMEGTPYLWGGTSTKALDCSGLAKVSYLSNGIILMRDASQQATTGTRIEATDWRTCEPGDLLFFGTRSGKVTHVAIYDHDGNYVHSSGRVKRNSVDPESEAYLTTPFLHAVRIHGNEGSRGITLVREHPWYFNL